MKYLIHAFSVQITCCRRKKINNAFAMLVSSKTHVVVLETGPVVWSKITKKRDERTERGNRKIIERRRKTVEYIAKLVLSAHPLFKSCSLQVRHARRASLIRFICLSSDIGQPIRDFQPANTLQRPGTYCEELAEY